MEVDFVTLGDAAERMDIKDPTLRRWTDQLEEFGVHYVKRNERNERLYYEDDIEIFSFMRQIRNEHGNKARIEHIVNMLKAKSEEPDTTFKLRSKEDAPVPNPSNKTAGLVTNESIQRLAENPSFQLIMDTAMHVVKKEFIGEIQDLRLELEQSKETLIEVVQENQNNTARIIEEMTENQAERDTENQKNTENLLKKIEEKQALRDEEQKKMIDNRDLESMKKWDELMAQKQKEIKENQSKGLLSKLFKKN